MRLHRQAAGLLVAAALASGCGYHPRVVVAMDGASPDRMKLLYQEGATFGVVKCKVAPDGKLTDCVNMPVNLHE
jgi:hypothetical protein